MPSIFHQAVNWALQNAGESAQRLLSSLRPSPAIAESIRPVIWILEQAGKCVKKNTKYYWDHPGEAWEDLSTYAKENPTEFILMCVLIIGGILTIAIPPALGFGAAGIGLGTIAAGWQSAIGSVVAGSLFATLTAMGMTGAFVTIGGTMIALGSQAPLLGWLCRRLKALFADTSISAPNNLRRVLQSSTATGSIIRRTNGIYPGPGWFLEPEHMTIEERASPSAEYGSSTALIDKRTIITNSKETFDMVWKDLNVATNSRTIKQHALLGYDVVIELTRPRRSRGEEGFYERFEDHETHCIEDCWCVGDMDDIPP